MLGDTGGGTCRVKVLTTSQFVNFYQQFFFVAMVTVMSSQRFQFFCGRTQIVGGLYNFFNMFLLVVALLEYTPQ